MNFIKPNWNAPRFIHALSTTRQGGCSQTPYDSLNLALHVQDQVQAVLENRNRIQQQFNLPHDICWLNQTHSAEVISAHSSKIPAQADGSYTQKNNQVCIILTADCLPILICHQNQPEIAAIHAGWKGLAAGILQNTFSKLKNDPENYLVWIGPCIRNPFFIVRQDVLDAFHAKTDAQMRDCFTPISSDQFQADLIAITTLILKRIGVKWIYDSGHCTYQESNLFFSARRDGLHSGRLASLIWIDHINPLNESDDSDSISE